MPPLLDRPWQGAFTSGRIRKVSGLATLSPACPRLAKQISNAG